MSGSIHDLSNVEVRFVENLDDAMEFKRWLGERREVLAFDIETSGLDFWQEKIRLAQFGDWDTAWAIPWEDWRWLIA